MYTLSYLILTHKGSKYVFRAPLSEFKAHLSECKALLSENRTLLRVCTNVNRALLGEYKAFLSEYRDLLSEMGLFEVNTEFVECMQTSLSEWDDGSLRVTQEPYKTDDILHKRPVILRNLAYKISGKNLKSQNLA